MLCGDVNLISPLMRKQLGEWAALDMKSNCWEFNVNSTSLVVNFMKQHGWTVRIAGEHVQLGNNMWNSTSTFVDDKGQLRPVSHKKPQKIGEISASMAGKLMNKKERKKIDRSDRVPNVNIDQSTRFRIGDIVSWMDKDGRQKGRVERANDKYFVITDLNSGKELPSYNQNSEFVKLIERPHSFENFPVGIAVSYSNSKRAKVTGHDLKKNRLITETYNGDSDDVSMTDPSLKIVKIDAHARSSQFRPRQKIKYRLAGTKTWIEGVVLKVGEESIEVSISQNKVNVNDQGIVKSDGTEIMAKVSEIRHNQIDFTTTNDVSVLWEVGKEIYFMDVSTNNEYRLTVSSHHRKGEFTANIQKNSALYAQHITIPLTCLSLTIITSSKTEKEGGYVEFEHYKPDMGVENLTMRARRKVTKKLENIVLTFMQGKEYGIEEEDANKISVIGRWKIEDAQQLEENLWNKNTNLMDYLYHSLLLMSALDAADYSIGMYTTFFRKHVKSQLFPFSKLHKATLQYILPEMTKNPNLDDLQYGKAIATLKHIIHGIIREFIHEVKMRREDDPTARIRPLKTGYSQYASSIEKFVVKNIHDLCSNIGSEEIPTESLVLCHEGGKFYCYSVQDVVKNIEKADSIGEIAANPFTGVEWDSTFIKRIREMFMDTDRGREYLSQFPEPNRTYNLVTGDVIPEKEFSKSLKGVTISDLLGICPELKGKCLSLEAGQLLQTMALRIIKSIIVHLDPDNSHSYFETDSIIKAARVWLNEFNTRDSGIAENAVYNAIFQIVAVELNSVAGSVLKDENTLAYKEFTYADELMESEKKHQKGIETSIKGMLTFGIIIYSFLRLTLEPLRKQEIITYDMISDRVKSEPYLFFVFGTELPVSESSDYGSFFDEPKSPVMEEPTIIAVSGKIPKDNPQNYAKENTLVKSFYEIQPSLLKPAKAKKEAKHKFSVTAGHQIYNFIMKFIRGILATNPDKTYSSETMFNMLNMYILDKKFTNDDFSMTLTTSVTNYMNASDVSQDAIGKLNKVQSSLLAVLKSEGESMKFKEKSSHILSFAVGSLIYYLFSNIVKTKHKDIDSDQIIDEIANDDNLSKINK